MVDKSYNQQMPDRTSTSKNFSQARFGDVKAAVKTKMDSTAEKVIVAEELEIVRESLQKLDDSLLGPVVLRYFCDFNSKEVGEILGLNPSTVRSRLREARMILAKRLLERGVEP